MLSAVLPFAVGAYWYAAVQRPARQVCVSCSEQSNMVIIHVNTAIVVHNIGYSLPHRVVLILSYYAQHVTILSIMQGQYYRLGRPFWVISL